MELVDVAEPALAIGGRGPRVEDVEEAVLGVVGVERHREQAALALLGGQVVDVEELALHPVVDDFDGAAALHHEQPRVARRRGHEDRVVEGADRLQGRRPGALRHREEAHQASRREGDPDRRSHPVSHHPHSGGVLWTDLVAIVIALVRALDRDADVGGLLGP